MLESEKTVHERAASGDEIPRSVCTQLLADSTRYSLWRTRHERSMTTVAASTRRERQILKLRSVSLVQVHRTALIRYLRHSHVKGDERDRLWHEFYGVVDPERAAVIEHQNYLLAASTQLCAADLLDLVGDSNGLDLVRRYEGVYGQYFGMFCDRARARRGGLPLTSVLIPEARQEANALRSKILAGDGMPPVTIYARSG